MANKVIQYRYYGEGNRNNYPTDVDSSQYVSGDVFLETLPILQLGIQTVPGTQFYLNGSPDPIIIGSTGIYELDLQNKTEISHLKFHPNLIDNINDEKTNAYLIVDIVYEKMEDE